MAEEEQPEPAAEGEQPERGGDAARGSRSSCARSASRTCCWRASSASSTSTARRIAKEDERDLEQARVGIEAVRAVVDLLDRRAGEQVRSALSRAPDALRPKQARAAPVEPEGGDARRRRAPRRRPAAEQGRAAAAAHRALDAARDASSRGITLDSARFAAASPAAARCIHSRTEDSDLTDFLTDYGVVIALVCAGAAVLYGALITQRLLAPLARQRADAGDLGRRPGGRRGLPEPPVHDHRRRSRSSLAVLLAIVQRRPTRRSAS